MFGLGVKELIIIVLVILLLFGLTKLPSLFKNIVESAKIVKGAFKGKGIKK